MILTKMLQLSTDEQFHFEILRILGHAAYGAADIGECLQAASEIAPGDFESWYAAWNKRAEVLLSIVDKLTNPISIRDTMFRAATYLRAAEFFLHGNWDDPRITELWCKQTACFNAAMARMRVPGSRNSIQTTEGFHVNIIFFPAASLNDTKKRPTVVMCNGYDGSMEEMYHVLGAGALERGFNVICCDGPGQPSVRRDQGLGFTHEWEKVVSPVIDWACTLPNVEASKIAVFGYSMSGVLAARAAAFDDRVAAVISVDGLYDFSNSPVVEKAASVPQLADIQTFEGARAFYEDPALPTPIRWAISHGLWAFNVRTPGEYLDKTRAFSLVGLADKIQCPVFVGDAEEDLFFKGQPQAMAEALGDRATLVTLTDEDECAGAHCHCGASRLACSVIWDWFEKVVDRK